METETEITRRLKGISAWMYTPAGDDTNAAYPKHLREVDLESLRKVNQAVKGDMIQRIDEISRKLGKAAMSSRLIRQQCHLENFEKEAASKEVKAAEPSNEVAVPEVAVPEVPVPEVPVEPSEERKNFRVIMDVSNFAQQTVDVDIRENRLVVHGKHEDIFDDHGTISREFTRTFEIPAEVDLETFRGLIDCYGVLTIEASFQPVNIEEKEIEIALDTVNPKKLWAFEDIGPGFRESAKRQIKDGMDMSDFVEQLAKQPPSTFIPYYESA